MFLLSLFSWFHFSSISEILDIVIVFIIALLIFRALKGKPAINILIAIAFCILLYLLAKQFNFPILRLIFKTIISTGLVGIIVVFQPELRKFLIEFGKNSPFGKNGFITKLFSNGTLATTNLQEQTAEHIGKCLAYCVSKKIGATIVLLPNSNVDFDLLSGVEINGILSSKLLESIFEKQSPLHDGAVVIQKNQILSARVVLPLSEDTNLPVRMGLRHRSAIGATEHNDSVMTIIVSEERNTISYALEGKLFENRTVEEVKQKVVEVMKK